MRAPADNPRDLNIHRRLAAPVSAVWEAWSNPEALAQWWCPKPWQTEIKAFDFRPGGAFVARMSGPEPDGGESGVDAVFLHIEPFRQIVWTTVLTGGWRPAEKPFIPLTAIVSMKPDGDGTDYFIQAMHPTLEGARAHDEMGFMDGWGTCVLQMEEVAAGLAKARS